MNKTGFMLCMGLTAVLSATCFAESQLPDVSRDTQNLAIAAVTDDADTAKPSWLVSIPHPEQKVTLTQQEQRFIEKHPEVVLAGGSSFDPYLIENEDGTITGHDAELARYIYQRTGLKIRFEIGNWALMQQKARLRVVDGLSAAGFSQDRLKDFNHSVPYLKFTAMVIVSKGNPKGIFDIDDLAGKRVALQRGNKLFQGILANTTSDVEIVHYDSLQEALTAVTSHQVDFTLLDNAAFYLARKVGVDRLIESSFSVGEPFDIMFWLRNDWPELRSIINKALNSLSEQEKWQLREKWFGLVGNSSPSAAREIELNTEESAYLREKQHRIKLCIDPQWMPYEGINQKGQHVGMTADYFQLFAARLGISIKLIPTRNWGESLQAIQQHQCDLLSLARMTEERERYLNFTSAYLSVPNVVATRSDQFFIDDFEQTLDKTFAVVRNYAVVGELHKKYPQLSLLEVDSTAEGIRRVQLGEAFGHIGATAVIAASLQELGIVDIKIAGLLPIENPLRIASRNDERLLNQIFQKALDSITPDERDRIQRKWMAISLQRVTDYTLLWRALAVMCLVLILFIYWNRKLKQAKSQTEIMLNKLEQTQRELEKTNADLAHLSITDSLTQVYNRVKLDEILQTEILRSERHHNHFGLIMIDVDHFKQVNDSYGHQVGDKILIDVALLLETHIRSIDTLGRWGGEEFLVICPETDEQGIQILAENLRSIIASHSFPLEEGITASFGIARYCADDTATSIIGRADKALYLAKANGRNRVEVA